MTISLYCYISDFLHSYTVLSLFESSLYMYIDSCMLPGSSSVVTYLLASLGFPAESLPPITPHMLVATLLRG